jgi:hypothetical protein
MNQYYKPGERHPRAKLTEADAVEILGRVRRGERYRVLAEEKGVAIGTISKIVSGTNWKHLDRGAL